MPSLSKAERCFVSNGAPPRRPSEIDASIRAAIPFLRDLLLAAAILFYVVGFAYQTSVMQRAGFDADPGDARASVVIAAAAAVREGAFIYAAIAVGALALILVAAVIKRVFARSTLCRPCVSAVLAGSVLFAVVGSSLYAWHEGAADRIPATPNATPARETPVAFVRP